MPRTLQRLIICVAVVIGGWIWVQTSAGLLAADGSSGISLLSARWHPVAASFGVVLTGLPAIGLGLIAAASGNPILGLLAVAGSLSILAAHGGAVDGWLRRHEHLSGAYGALIGEVILWQVGVVLLLLLIQTARPALRRGWSALAFDRRPDSAFALQLTRPWSVGGGLICAAVAAVVGFLLIRSSDTGQVIGSLVVAFAAGSTAATTICRRCNPLGVFFSPALVAIGVYLWVVIAFGADADQLRAAWYLQESEGGLTSSKLPGLAKALPIHFISAGLVGCCLGLGIGGGFVADDAPRDRTNNA